MQDGSPWNHVLGVARREFICALCSGIGGIVMLGDVNNAGRTNQLVNWRRSPFERT